MCDYQIWLQPFKTHHLHHSRATNLNWNSTPFSGCLPSSSNTWFSFVPGHLHSWFQCRHVSSMMGTVLLMSDHMTMSGLDWGSGMMCQGLLSSENLVESWMTKMRPSMRGWYHGDGCSDAATSQRFRMWLMVCLWPHNLQLSSRPLHSAKLALCGSLSVAALSVNFMFSKDKVETAEAQICTPISLPSRRHCPCLGRALTGSALESASSKESVILAFILSACLEAPGSGVMISWLWCIGLNLDRDCCSFFPTSP